MPSSLFNLLSLFALFAASFSMLVEPVIKVLVDSPVHQCADTDSDADDDDDEYESLLSEDDDDDESLSSEVAMLDYSLTLECRITLLSDVTTPSRNLAGDPRGPPAASTTQIA
ncbi:MAG: hypothetical protein O3B13_10585 [Planctomycetota bacterium]|nr:hypothetical protein [Planctomycetota bacterium]MDA1163539.1 hypothetical protein [Planctomycetota bacterium]